MRLPLPALLSLLFSCSTPVQGLIHYDGDNSKNLTTPDSARENAFNSVGRIAGAARGSVVHIKGKYLLTAQHVNTSTNLVSFDGTTTWAIDTAFGSVQIDGSDMKLIKLVDDPGLPDTPLFDGLTGDTLVTATLIGWGVGRDPNVADSGGGSTNIWEWGNSGTMSKRWGTNRIDLAASGTIAGFTYNYLRTDLDRNAGNDEVGAALYDSGSGLFINDGGTWKLAGVTAAVSSINGPTEEEPDIPQSSTFSLGNLFNPNDTNFFVRISSYVDDIEQAIPDATTYEGWQIDHSLYGNDALGEADTDSDRIGQLLEFAFGGDPNANDSSILPTFALVNEASEDYLELTITRPTDLQNITYLPQTTSDLSSWPSDSAGIQNASPTPQDNGDGTETLTYRRAQAVDDSSRAFIRIEVQESQL